MGKYRILVSDFDGTFLRSDLTVSKGNIEAVKKFQEKGGIFVISTGRMTDGFTEKLKAFGYTGIYSCFNGAEINDIQTGKNLFKGYIDNETTIKFMEFVESHDINGQIYPDSSLMIKRRYGKFTDIYEKNGGAPAHVREDWIEYIKSTKKESAKLLLFDYKEKIDKVYEEVCKILPNCNCVRSSDNLVEINRKDISKGSTIHRLSSLFNVPIEEIIACGDAGNDVSMLKEAGLSVCMENGIPEAKKYADVICPTNDNDGIKWVIEKYCL